MNDETMNLFEITFSREYGIRRRDKIYVVAFSLDSAWGEIEKNKTIYKPELISITFIAGMNPTKGQCELLIEQKEASHE